MIKKIVIAFLFFTLLQNSAFAMQKTGGSYYGKAPDFMLKDLNGDTVSLSDFKGRPVVMFFWTTKCPYCRSYLFTMEELRKTLEADGIKLLSVNTGESQDKVSAFMQRNNLNFNTLLDKSVAVTYSFKVIGVPTFIFIDKEGNICFRGNKFPQYDYKALILK